MDSTRGSNDITIYAVDVPPPRTTDGPRAAAAAPPARAV